MHTTYQHFVTAVMESGIHSKDPIILRLWSKEELEGAKTQKLLQRKEDLLLQLLKVNFWWTFVTTYYQLYFVQ